MGDNERSRVTAESTSWWRRRVQSLSPTVWLLFGAWIFGSIFGGVVYHWLSGRGALAQLAWPLALAMSLFIVMVRFRIRSDAVAIGALVVAVVSILFRWTPLAALMTFHLHQTLNATFSGLCLAAGWPARRSIRLLAIILIFGIVGLRYTTSRFWDDLKQKRPTFERDSQR